MIVPDFRDGSGNWVMTFGSSTKKEQKYTWMGRKYLSMLSRCKIDGPEQRRYPRYAGCYSTFDGFQDFAEWACRQAGWGEDGFEIDKDLLGTGTEKVYSKETCAFVPKEINLLLNKVKPLRSKYGIGVKKTKYNSFTSKIKYNNENVHLGTFKTAEEAFVAYKTAKEEKVKMLALKYKDKIDPRCFNLLMNFEVNRDD